jgi:molecular chaperone HscB
MPDRALRLGPAAVPEPSKNYFELFDLPLGFAVDAKRLAERYRSLQAATQPRAAIEREWGHRRRATTQINEAYRILKDPLARAEYLLALHTGETDGDNEAGRDGAFLMERMELWGTLAEAQGAPNPPAAVARILTQLAERSLVLDKELEGLFAEPTAQNLEQAREILRKLQLLDRCRRDGEALQAELGPRG